MRLNYNGWLPALSWVDATTITNTLAYLIRKKMTENKGFIVHAPRNILSIALLFYNLQVSRSQTEHLLNSHYYRWHH
jgi:hypothetical protein